MRTNGRTRRSLIVALHNFANAPKQEFWIKSRKSFSHGKKSAKAVTSSTGPAKMHVHVPEGSQNAWSNTCVSCLSVMIVNRKQNTPIR